MTTTDQGPDEKRVRAWMARKSVGVRGLPPAVDTATRNDPTTWWTALYDDRHADHHPSGTKFPALVPAQPERGSGEPQQARKLSDRLGDWRKRETVDLHGSTPEDMDPRAEKPADSPEEATGDPGTTEADPDSPGPDPEESGVTWKKVTDPADPALRATSGKKTPGPARRAGQALAEVNPRLRATAFNGSAAAAGYLLGLVPYMGRYLDGSVQAENGVIATAFTAAAVVGSWRFTGTRAFAEVVPQSRIIRPIVTVGASWLGYGLAPAATSWLNVHATTSGFGPDSLSVLVTSVTGCGGLWWLIDRRTRAWTWGYRLILRIPLASAVLATALCAHGATS